MVNIIFIALIFAITPLLSKGLQYAFSRQVRKLNLFKKHLIAYYYDLILVPFNFLWIYSVSISMTLFYWILIFSVIGNVYMHFFYWKEVHYRKKEKSHFYYVDSGKITYAGVVHFLFSIFESILIVSFLLSFKANNFAYMASVLLGLFFLTMIPSSKSIHNKIEKSDLAFVSIGMFVLIIKVLMMVFG